MFSPYYKQYTEGKVDSREVGCLREWTQDVCDVLDAMPFSFHVSVVLCPVRQLGHLIRNSSQCFLTRSRLWKNEMSNVRHILIWWSKELAEDDDGVLIDALKTHIAFLLLFEHRHPRVSAVIIFANFFEAFQQHRFVQTSLDGHVAIFVTFAQPIASIR